AAIAVARTVPTARPLRSSHGRAFAYAPERPSSTISFSLVLRAAGATHLRLLLVNLGAADRDQATREASQRKNVRPDRRDRALPAFCRESQYLCQAASRRRAGCRLSAATRVA